LVPLEKLISPLDLHNSVVSGDFPAKPYRPRAPLSTKSGGRIAKAGSTLASFVDEILVGPSVAGVSTGAHMGSRKPCTAAILEGV
jgi:hypothetical protein